MNLQKGILIKGRSVVENFLHLGTIQVSNALVQILLFPFIIRVTGIEAFGPVVVANSFAALIGLLVNFGTSISGVQAVAGARGNMLRLSQLFSQTLTLRLALLVIPVLALPLVFWVTPQYFWFILLAMPLVLAELINPLYFFNGTEQLLPYNIGNLISKLGGVLLILFFIRSAEAAPWVNFFLGVSTLVMFALLNAYLFKNNGLTWGGWKFTMLPSLIKQNLPLAGNNLSVQLQQSFFLFVLSGIGNSALLGAYAIADKVLWGFRLILIAFSNALFPKAVLLAKADPVLARQRKQQINMVLVLLFSVVALVLYFQAGWMVQLFAGEESAIATNLVRAISCVPLLMALNLLNVLEMLIQQRYRDMFKIALLLTTLTVVISILIVRRGETETIAWYPFIMELAALMLYMFFLGRKTSLKSVA